MSAETDSLIRFLRFTGVPHRVTSVVRDQPGSFHHVGLAIDAAGPVPGSNTPELRAVYEALLPLAGVAEELFYGGTGGALWRDGTKFTHAGLKASHLDHVHIAVPMGWRFTEAPSVPDDPNLPNLYDIKFFVPVVDAAGQCRGYYFVSSKGEVHGWGPGATYYGRSEVL